MSDEERVSVEDVHGELKPADSVDAAGVDDIACGSPQAASATDPRPVDRASHRFFHAGLPGIELPVAPLSGAAAAAHVGATGANGAPSLAEQVARVPTDPGCYLWKDAAGEVIYVGKAKNLRARMKQYVQLTDDREKIPLMMQLVASFDYLVVSNEHEALVLERNLIAQYHPYFNVDFKDDKSYPFIALTKGDLFPAIKYTREKHRAGTRYFGPYTDSRAARDTLDTLRKVVRELREDMAQAAEELDFERAGRIKRRLEVISGLDDRQQVVFPSSVDIDVVGFFREETIAGACVFCVREGRVVRSCEFILDKGLDVSVEELTEGFLKRYYDETADIPSEVDVAVELADAELLGTWLAEKRGRVCRLHHPQRGEKRHLLDMCERNARHALMRYSMRTGYADDRTNQALLQLESALALPAAPLRIECFDISTLHGNFTVASMVVFTNGRPDKSQYRRFKIRAELDEANDFVSMQEVLGRRYAPERMADERFGSRPDLLVVDGGKPQLSAALSQLNALGLDIPVCGLAKSDEEVFVPWDDTPVVLPNGSASLYLIKQVRDESHRFAITFHRELRDKAMTVSVLDEVPGVGPTRKRAIMRHFGSMKRLRAASAEDIAAVKGVPADVARAVWQTLQATQRS